ncbi:MAG: 30S ribosomal protein S1 [Ruminococcaceae bacterium]|nr:30S ribosomal protein S1 [Oscillospiraceae bacterium]MBQ7119751.1 30S ribosomal protein S1 [Oscillospiraceae bacterium]
MSCGIFSPEGALIHTEENRKLIESPEKLYYALENELILEGMAILCDAEHNLIVDLCGYRGVIPHRDTASGIEDGSTREIAVISRVGKPVSFLIDGIEDRDGTFHLKLSRRKAQERALTRMLTDSKPGDIIPARITHLESFGAFVDIGCGNISLIGIEAISVSRISHPQERFKVGSDIFAVISNIDTEKRRINLSHRELLGTWKENIAVFEVGQTVRGIVRGIEDYGVFIELAPNLSGLAEYRDDVEPGSCVSVYIKSIIPEKMKIKLVIIDLFDDRYENIITKNDYRLTSGHIDLWQYSPKECTKKEIISKF